MCQRKELQAELGRFDDVFSDLPGKAKLPAFTIETGNAHPVSA